MFLDTDYFHDSEFRKLLTRRSDVDLTQAALELARDADPDIDFDKTRRWIADRAKELSGPVALAKTDGDALGALAECLSGTHGLGGDAEVYRNPESSFLHRVIETKRGLPITLSVLYMAVAKEVGIELQGVAAPLHFVTRYESVDGPVFVDAFSGGELLTFEECVKWIRSISGLSAQAVVSSLKPVGPRSIIVRMLTNLKSLYVPREEWAAAWPVQRRLAALQPSSYEQRRDLAVVAMKSNRAGQAIDLFQSCLKICPPDDRELLETQLEAAKNQQARWN